MKFIRGCQVAFAIVLSGCASAPKIQSISSINAIYPVVVGIGDEQAFVVVRESYPSFENVIFFRSVEVLALQQEKLGNGKLWISAQITNNTNPKWVPIEGLSGWSSTSLSTRAGEKTSALSTRLYWCPIDVNPEILATDCRITKKLHGTKYDKKITPKGPIYTGSPGYQDTFDVFGVQPGTRVKEVLDKAQLEVERLAQRQAREATVRAEAEAKAREKKEAEAREAERIKRLKNAASGTQDECTSVFLLNRSEPVGPSVGLKCGVYGSTSIGELRANGWNVQVTSRIPTEGWGGWGDAVSVSIRKQ